MDLLWIRGRVRVSDVHKRFVVGCQMPDCNLLQQRAQQQRKKELKASDESKHPLDQVRAQGSLLFFEATRSSSTQATRGSLPAQQEDLTSHTLVHHLCFGLQGLDRFGEPLSWEGRVDDDVRERSMMTRTFSNQSWDRRQIHHGHSLLPQ